MNGTTTVMVEMTVLEGGERMPLLFRASPYRPLLVPLLYVTIRRRYQKSRTLLRDMRALRALFHWCAHVRRIPLDLDCVLMRGASLSASDIEAFVRWLRVGGLRRAHSKANAIRSTRVLAPVSLHNYVIPAGHHTIRLIRKGRKHGYVIASESLFAETDSYISLHRAAWIHRASRRGHPQVDPALFIGPRGTAVRKNTYQQVIGLAAQRCGFVATTHQLRTTFACMMLARLEQLAKTGVPINPLLVVKVLMGHEHIETTDRYLRAIAVDTHVLADVLESLLPPVDGA